MKDLNFLKNSLFAHRGLHTKDLKIPENTISAFLNAIDNNFDIELDILLSKDNKIIVFHDENLNRIFKIDEKVKNLTFEQLQKNTIYDTDQKIPLLVDVLKLVNHKANLLIEIKPSVDIKKMGPIFINEMKNFNGKWAVFSFNPFIINWFRKNYPDVIRGQISKMYSKNDNFFLRLLLNKMRTNIITKPDFISYYIKDLPKKFLNKINKKKVVISYTATNQEQFDLVKKHYDNVVFEHFIPKQKEKEDSI